MGRDPSSPELGPSTSAHTSRRARSLPSPSVSFVPLPAFGSGYRLLGASSVPRLLSFLFRLLPFSLVGSDRCVEGTTAMSAPAGMVATIPLPPGMTLSQFEELQRQLCQRRCYVHTLRSSECERRFHRDHRSRCIRSYMLGLVSCRIVVSQYMLLTNILQSATRASRMAIIPNGW